MIIRGFLNKDFEDVSLLYKTRFDFHMTRDIYNYLYYNPEHSKYCSFVAEHEGRIVGHNAIIENYYFIRNMKLLVGLFSGGVVDKKYAGVFHKILNKSMGSFSGDLLIAFPNKNSEPFFTKLLSFRSFENYYSITSKKIKVLSNLPF